MTYDVDALRFLDILPPQPESEEMRKARFMSDLRDAVDPLGVLGSYWFEPIKPNSESKIQPDIDSDPFPM